ncbi:MAG: hypothetical protein IPI30_21650 [Saprospiraceae bacterium]|nr:hypothetical protein [Candidatus Vicinibacter affinis]
MFPFTVYHVDVEFGSFLCTVSKNKQVRKFHFEVTLNSDQGAGRCNRCQVKAIVLGESCIPNKDCIGIRFFESQVSIPILIANVERKYVLKLENGILVKLFSFISGIMENGGSSALSRQETQINKTENKTPNLICAFNGHVFFHGKMAF